MELSSAALAQRISKSAAISLEGISKARMAEEGGSALHITTAERDAICSSVVREVVTMIQERLTGSELTDLAVGSSASGSLKSSLAKSRDEGSVPSAVASVYGELEAILLKLQERILMVESIRKRLAEAEVVLLALENEGGTVPQPEKQQPISQANGSRTGLASPSSLRYPIALTSDSSSALPLLSAIDHLLTLFYHDRMQIKKGGADVAKPNMIDERSREPPTMTVSSFGANRAHAAASTLINNPPLSAMEILNRNANAKKSPISGGRLLAPIGPSNGLHRSNVKGSAAATFNTPLVPSFVRAFEEFSKNGSVEQAASTTVGLAQHAHVRNVSGPLMHALMTSIPNATEVNNMYAFKALQMPIVGTTQAAMRKVLGPYYQFQHHGKSPYATVMAIQNAVRNPFYESHVTEVATDDQGDAFHGGKDIRLRDQLQLEKMSAGGAPSLVVGGGPEPVTAEEALRSTQGFHNQGLLGGQPPTGTAHSSHSPSPYAYVKGKALKALEKVPVSYTLKSVDIIDEYKKEKQRADRSLRGVSPVNEGGDGTVVGGASTEAPHQLNDAFDETTSSGGKAAVASKTDPKQVDPFAAVNMNAVAILQQRRRLPTSVVNEVVEAVGREVKAYHKEVEARKPDKKALRKQVEGMRPSGKNCTTSLIGNTEELM